MVTKIYKHSYIQRYMRSSLTIKEKTKIKLNILKYKYGFNSLDDLINKLMETEPKENE